MFVLIWEDTHADTEAYLFDSFEKAYEYATTSCLEAYEDNDVEIDYTLTPTMRNVGWLFCAQGEYFLMRIEKKEINPIAPSTRNYARLAQLGRATVL